MARGVRVWLLNHGSKGLEEQRVAGHIVSTVRKMEGIDGGAQLPSSILFSLGADGSAHIQGGSSFLNESSLETPL